jgi:hypothetical protein
LAENVWACSDFNFGWVGGNLRFKPQSYGFASIGEVCDRQNKRLAGWQLTVYCYLECFTVCTNTTRRFQLSQPI